MARMILLGEHKVTKPYHGALFQHVPRTGGTWVEQAINVLGLPCVRWIRKQPKYMPKKHCLLSHYWPSAQEKVQFVFLFVRHPMSYYETTWKFLRTLTHTRRCGFYHRWPWHPQAAAARVYNRPGVRDNWGAWIDAMIEHEPMWVTRLFEQYAGPETGEFANFIGRQETLQQDFETVIRFLGHGRFIDDSREALNAMPRHNARTVPIPWTSSQRDAIEHVERLACRRFYSTDTEGERFYARASEEYLEELAAHRAAQAAIYD